MCTLTCLRHLHVPRSGNAIDMPQAVSRSATVAQDDAARGAGAVAVNPDQEPGDHSSSQASQDTGSTQQSSPWAVLASLGSRLATCVKPSMRPKASEAEAASTNAESRSESQADLEPKQSWISKHIDVFFLQSALKKGNHAK